MYEAPKLIDLGSFADITLSNITKLTGGMDTLTYVTPSGQVISTGPIDGHGAKIS